MPTRLNGPMIKIDLLPPARLQLAIDLINNRACQFVHFAPPCGTASRARLIQRADRPMPPPLRDDNHPNACLGWRQTKKSVLAKPTTPSHANSSSCVATENFVVLWKPRQIIYVANYSFRRLFSTIKCMSTELHRCRFGSSRSVPNSFTTSRPTTASLSCATTNMNTNLGDKNQMAPLKQLAFGQSNGNPSCAALQTKGVECHLPSFAEQECTLQEMRASTNVQSQKITSFSSRV